MEKGLLDDEKKDKILNMAGPEFIEILDQLDAEQGTPKDRFPPTRRPGNGDQIDAERGAVKDQFPPKKRPRYGEMATSRVPLSPWDRQNPREAEYMDTSQYRKNLNKSRVILRDKLQVADLWPHLRQMGVITSHDEERMRLGATRCESVDRLIAFLMKSQTWRYHAVLRAMALTQQAHLIPQGGLHPAVYTVDMEPCIVSGIEQDKANSANKEMATCGAPLPPWDRQNPQEVKFVDKSCYQEILNKSIILLRDNLQVADLWPHLRQMGVITSHDEERMKLGATRCESVDRLIAFVEISQTWCYHAVLRAMALTQQTHLIPQGGLDPAVYTVDMEPGIVSGIEKDNANSAIKVPPQPANPRQCSELRGSPITIPDSAGMYHAPQQQPTQVHHYYHYQQQPRDKTKITAGFKLTGENENIKKSIEEDLRTELFCNNITKAIQASFGMGAPNMIVKYTNPGKRFVRVEIDDNGVGQGMLTEALHGAKVRSRVEAGKEYTIVRDSVVFMDMVGAAIASEIYKQQHVTEHELDKTIDLEKNYVRLRLLDVKNMGVTDTDDIKMNTDKDRPDYYQLYLEKCGGTDIQEEDLVTDEDIGKCTLLRGRAGIGKSTTVHQLFWKWAHGEWGKRFKAVFLLNIRHFLHTRTKIDFWKLLNSNSVYAPGNMDEAWLKDNEEHLCVVVDGIDEVWNFKGKYHEKGFEDDVKCPRRALEWCLCLLQKKHLRQATLIVSSRPFADLSLIKPSKLVELMGLTRELVMEFVDCNVRPERVEYVKKTLRDNPILLSVSSITYYCAALCRVLEDTDLGTEDLRTYTQINSYIIQDYMKRCLKAGDGKPVDINPSLQAISKLAYSGLKTTGPFDLTRLVFSQSEYKDLGIREDQIGMMRSAGLFCESKLQDKESAGEERTMGQFVHLSVQEFLAMAGYIHDDDPAVKKTISAMFESGQFNMAQLYLFGLVFNTAHPHVGGVTAQMGVTDGRLQGLREELENKLKPATEASKRIHGMQCVYEAQSEKMAEWYAQKCWGDEVNFDTTPLTTIDINALEFTLRHCLDFLKKLYLEEVNLDVTSVHTVVGIVNRSTNLEYLGLIDKMINEECLQVLEEKWDNSTLVDMSLGCGPIGDKGIASIKNILRKAKGLRSLGLTFNDVDDAGVKEAVAEVCSLPMLTRLYIFSDKVTDDGVAHIAVALKGFAHLEKLMFKTHNVTDKGLLSLTSALDGNQTVRELWIESTSVTDVGAQHVAHLVSTSTHLERVRLYVSSIQEKGVDAIMDAMDKNQTIKMWLRLENKCEPSLEQRLRTCDRLTVWW